MTARISVGRRRLLSGAAADQLLNAVGSGLFLLLVAEGGSVALTGSAALVTAMVLMATNPIRALAEDWIYAEAGTGRGSARPTATSRSATGDPVATVIAGSLWLGLAGTPLLAVLVLAGLGREFAPGAVLLAALALPASVGSAAFRTGQIAIGRSFVASASSLVRLVAVLALGPLLVSGPSTTAMAGAWAVVSAIPIIIGLATASVPSSELVSPAAVRTLWARRGGLVDPTLIAASGTLGLVIVGRLGTLPDIASIRAAAALLAPLTTVLSVLRISNLDAFRSDHSRQQRPLLDWFLLGFVPVLASLSVVMVLQIRSLWPLELLQLAGEALPMLALVPALQILVRWPIDRASYDGRYRRLSTARLIGEGVFLVGLVLIDTSANSYFGLRAASMVALLLVLTLGRVGPIAGLGWIGRPRAEPPMSPQTDTFR